MFEGKLSDIFYEISIQYELATIRLYRTTKLIMINIPLKLFIALKPPQMILNLIEKPLLEKTTFNGKRIDICIVINANLDNFCL